MNIKKKTPTYIKTPLSKSTHNLPSTLLLHSKSTKTFPIKKSSIFPSKKSNINISNDFFQTSLLKTSSQNIHPLPSSKRTNRSIDYKKSTKSSIQLYQIKTARENRTKIGFKSIPIINHKRKIKNNFNKNYNFKEGISPEYYLYNQFHSMEKIQKKINNNHVDAGLREISYNYIKCDPVALPLNFSERFRPVQDVFEIEKADLPFIKKRERVKKKEIKKTLFAKKMKIIIEQKIKEDQEKKRNLLLLFKEIIIKACLNFKRYNLNLEQYLEDFTLNQNVKINEDTRIKFINSIKENDIKLMSKMLLDIPELINIKDNFNQTPLHIASKRNKYKIISFLIYKGAYVNAQDFVGQTPLYLASLHNCLETVQILLYEFADPSIKSKSNKKPFDVTQSEHIQYILKRASVLHIVSKIGKVTEYERRIRRGLDFLYENEYRKHCKEIKQYLYI